MLKNTAVFQNSAQLSSGELSYKNKKGVIIKKSLKSKILVAGAATAVGLSGVAGLSVVSAESALSANKQSNLVDKLASKFSLNKEDVQKVFNEDRAEHKAAREQERSQQLQKLVEAGTITASQKTAIEAKVKELETARESNKDSAKDLTREERRAKIKEERAGLEAWAKEQGIDLTKLRGVFMGHGPWGGLRGPSPDSN